MRNTFSKGGNWPRNLVATGGAAALMLACPAVFAQTTAGPRVIASPLGQATAGNQPRTTLVPSVRAVFDSNVLRQNDPDGAPTDNFRVTPGIDLAIRRLFGRTLVNVGGSAGYDFNTRYRFLNRSRIDVTGGLRTQVGAICSVGATARYEQFQFDLADVNQTLGSTTRNQTYDVSGGCNRNSGFSPVAGVTYIEQTSDGRSLFDYSILSGRAGLAYALPSLGTLTATASASRLSRPNIERATGVADGTDIRRVLISLDRRVSPRLHFNLGAGYVDANPDRPGIRRFSGASFDGRIDVLFTPRFVLSAAALREVTDQNGIGATFIIREDYQTALDLQFGRTSRFRLQASRVQREFRGEDLAPAVTPIGADATNTVGASYSIDALQRLRLGLSASHRWRTADQPIYDYRSTLLATSIGAQF